MKDSAKRVKQEAGEKTKGEALEVSLSPLTFEDALSALLEVKPVDNAKLKKDAQKKKRKPTSKK